LLNAVENAKSVSEREALIKKYKKDIIFSKYKDDYLSVNTVNGVLTPVFNVLVKISERRAYDIQQVDYKDRFVVFNVIKSGKFNLAKLEKYIDYLRDPKNGQLSERLKDLCENEDFTEDDKSIIAHQVSEKFDQYYNMVGPKRCAELGYNTTYIRNEIKTLSADQEKLISLIYGAFKVNSRYSNAQAKEMLKKIYEACEIKQTAKASDLRGYFEVKAIQIYYPDKTKENGLEILGLKK
jgi:Glu-tRNA(Gln) amidotransferase subunit E-like FAD-binding protein